MLQVVSVEILGAVRFADGLVAIGNLVSHNQGKRNYLHLNAVRAREIEFILASVLQYGVQLSLKRNGFRLRGKVIWLTELVQVGIVWHQHDPFLLRRKGDKFWDAGHADGRNRVPHLRIIKINVDDQVLLDIDHVLDLGVNRHQVRHAVLRHQRGINKGY